ncbi:MAG: phospholipase [Alphaproteobacteria bacterium]|nr:phospholipase [Alphaproteobacteria bacterium]
MTSEPRDSLIAVLAPLLQSLERLRFISRHLDPAVFHRVLTAVGAPDATLRAALPPLADWPEEMAETRAILIAAAEETLAAFDALRAADADESDIGAIFRALRHVPAALEVLFTLSNLKAVSQFFLDPAMRQDEALLAGLSPAERREDTGIAHIGNEAGERGGFSLYVPETYSPDRPAPLVMALHGGMGSGRSFLWSWLRDARSHGAILVAPTARGRTWALMGEDVDTPNLTAILERVRAVWSIDPKRILLTGMSDGGTFSYVSGLQGASPFTHLAPISAAFHPMLAGMGDPVRLQGLPIHLVHGARDWMFPVQMARDARDALSAAGATVRYLEIEDLSHCYPFEANGAILTWLAGGV